MLFTVKDVSKVNVITTKFYARRFIFLCKKSTNERVLDKYLTENYKLPLIVACLKIINNASYNINTNGDLIITIIDKKLDKLASIITFGTGKVKGSNILKMAFGKI